MGLSDALLGNRIVNYRQWQVACLGSKRFELSRLCKERNSYLTAMEVADNLNRDLFLSPLNTQLFRTRSNLDKVDKAVCSQTAKCSGSIPGSIYSVATK